MIDLGMDILLLVLHEKSNPGQFTNTSLQGHEGSGPLAGGSGQTHLEEEEEQPEEERCSLCKPTSVNRGVDETGVQFRPRKRCSCVRERERVSCASILLVGGAT